MLISSRRELKERVNTNVTCALEAAGSQRYTSQDFIGVGGVVSFLPGGCADRKLSLFTEWNLDIDNHWGS